MCTKSQKQEHEHTASNASCVIAGLLVVSALVLSACGEATDGSMRSRESAQSRDVAAIPTYTIDSDLRDRSGVETVTGANLDAALSGVRPNNNGLIGLGQVFVDVAREQGLNPLYIAAHAAWESAWGTSNIFNDKNNLFGYGARDSCPYECALSFDSKEDGVRHAIPLIKGDYLVEGGRYYNGPTLSGMNVRYATDQNWKNGIASIMNSLAARISQ